MRRHDEPCVRADLRHFQVGRFFIVDIEDVLPLPGERVVLGRRAVRHQHDGCGPAFHQVIDRRLQMGGLHHGHAEADRGRPAVRDRLQGFL